MPTFLERETERHTERCQRQRGSFSQRLLGENVLILPKTEISQVKISQAFSCALCGGERKEIPIFLRRAETVQVALEGDSLTMMEARQLEHWPFLPPDGTL